MTNLKFLGEFFGTFILLMVILNQNGSPIPVGIGLTAALFVVAPLTGGHLNPAVTLVTAFKDPAFTQFVPYVISQFTGALAAWYIYKQATVQTLQQ